MTNYEYSKIAEPSERAMDTINEIFDEIDLAEVERQTLKNLMISLIRSEKTSAALEFHDMLRYNK